MQPIWASFWALNSINKGPFLSRFSGRFGEGWKIYLKIGTLSQKFIIIMDTKANYGNYR